MRSSLALTTLVTTFTIGSCQFQFQFLHRRQGTQGDDAQSSSLSSRTSWFWGQDGEVQKQTKTSSIESKEDGSHMKKRIVCKDGACTEVVESLEPLPLPPPTSQEAQWSPSQGVQVNPQEAIRPRLPSGNHMHPPPTYAEMHPGPPPTYAQMHPAPPPAYAQMHPAPPPTYSQMHQPPALRGMLDGLIEQVQHQQQPVIMEPVGGMQPPSRLRTILDRLYGNLQRQRAEEPQDIMIDPDFNRNGPELIVEPLPPQMQPSPSMGRWFSKNPAGRMIEVEIPRPPEQSRSFSDSGQSSLLTVVQVGMAIVAFSAAYALIFHALKCYRVYRASA